MFKTPTKKAGATTHLVKEIIPFGLSLGGNKLSFDGTKWVLGNVYEPFDFPN
jgi:hypothetical protein